MTADAGPTQPYFVELISLGGALIHTREEVRLNETYPMELTLNGDSPVKFRGRAVSCETVPVGSRTGYHIGIAFEEISFEEYERLRRFIALLES